MADNKDELHCPACGSVMDKKFIESMNAHIDICLKGCGGIFLDNREFEKIDEQHEDIQEIVALYEERAFRPVNEESVRVCPYCTAKMVKINNHGVVIDVCYTCGGKFLDFNELPRYRGQFASEQERSICFTNVLNTAMQTKIAPNNEKEIAPLETPTYTNGQMDEIIYSEPPKGILPRLATWISNKFRL
ncbi:zf-TFIIB domain-containing protein [bacterium]|nr:zf-TFIIB domain-containing protein [bacterium]